MAKVEKERQRDFRSRKEAKGYRKVTAWLDPAIAQTFKEIEKAHEVTHSQIINRIFKYFFDTAPSDIQRYLFTIDNNSPLFDHVIPTVTDNMVSKEDHEQLTEKVTDLEAKLEKLTRFLEAQESKPEITATTQKQTISKPKEPAKTKVSLGLAENIQIQVDQLKEALQWDSTKGKPSRIEIQSRKDLALPVIQGMLDAGVGSAGDIADRLNDAGIPTVSTDGTWKRGTISKWFRKS